LAVVTVAAGCGSNVDPKEFLGAWRTPGPEAAAAPDVLGATPVVTAPSATQQAAADTFGHAGHGAVNQCVIPVRIERGGFVPASPDRFVCAPGWKPAGDG
jgi:hypothetical protein